MKETGVIQSMKDFYWDIRPKPEYGTIELRVCDTPLTVERAALLAAYLQLLCGWLMETKLRVRESEYMVYTYNRFQACRFGLEGNYIDPQSRINASVRESVEATLRCIELDSNKLFLRRIGRTIEMIRSAMRVGPDSVSLQTKFQNSRSLEDLVQYSMRTFRETAD